MSQKLEPFDATNTNITTLTGEWPDEWFRPPEPEPIIDKIVQTIGGAPVGSTPIGRGPVT